LGLMYRDGRGVVQDYAKAMQWFQKAADLGYARGKLALCFIHNTTGREVVRD
jgi:TPR repeat protein